MAYLAQIFTTAHDLKGGFMANFAPLLSSSGSGTRNNAHRRVLDVELHGFVLEQP
jgi:hypothetical protein